MLNTLASFLIILIFAFSIHSIFKINASLTPIISLTSLISMVVCLSMVDMLYYGVIIAYIVAILSFVFAIYKNKDNLLNIFKSFFSTGVILFIIACIGMMIFLYLRQPLFSEWDEFSFWGTSQKLLHIHNQIYTYYDSSMIGNTTPPTLAVLSYFFQSFSTVFTEWKSFFAYDVMFFAAFSAFTAGFSKKNWHSSVMVYLFGFLSPYIFEVYTRIIHLEPMYISTYADIPLGIMFAACLAVYFFKNNEDDISLNKTTTRNILPLIPMFIYYTLMKDMGFAFSCIVVFIIFFDMIFCQKDFEFIYIKGFFGKILATITLLITTLSAFMGWSIHMGKVMSVNRFELGGSTNMGMVEMLTTGIVELFSNNKSQKFIDIQGEMITALYSSKISMLGTCVSLILIITAIFLFCILLSNKQLKIKLLIMYVTSFIGFILYYIFHLFLYVYIFKDNAYGLTSYNRYIYPYFIGWLALSVFAICLVIINKPKFILTIKSALFAFIMAIFILFNMLTGYENTFIGVHDRSYSLRLSIKSKIDYVDDYISDDDVIYCYSGLDDGERWFIYTYEFAQNMIVQEVPRLDRTDDMTDEEYLKAKQDQIVDYFKKNNITHLLLDHTGELTEYYLADMFSESTIDIGMSAIAYYKVEYTEDSMRFIPIVGGQVDV